MNAACRVVRSYLSTSSTPIVMKVGDKLQVEDRQTDMIGWVWCIHSDGKGSWVPESYIKREGDSAIALQDYNATELTVKVGEVLTILDEEAGWYWCIESAGEKGWVPIDHVELN